MTERLPFRKDIEGLRGLAVLLVVAYHANVPFVSGGFVGVDVFFVISGYLITALLTEEIARSGTIALPAFFARRIRRLLPAAAVVLVSTLLLSIVASPPLQMIDTAAAARAAAGYASNMHFMWLAFGYFSPNAAANPLLHTWSLALEEQFYLVWPLVLLAVARGAPGTFSRRRLGWALTALGLCSFVAAAWYATANRSLAFYAMPLRAWEFACGGLASLVVPALKPSRWYAAMGAIGSIFVIGAAMLYSATTEFPGATALLPVGGTAMLLVAGTGSPLRAMSANVMTWIGRRSYSWYLWHWPILVLGTAVVTNTGSATRIALAVLALLLADVTYRFVETPFRAKREHATRPGQAWRVIRFGLATTVVAMLTAEGARRGAILASRAPSQRAFTAAAHDVAQPHIDGCINEGDDDRVRVCVYGSPSAQRTIALFGDSHAIQWFPALDVIAKQRDWALIVIGKTRCATADVTVYISGTPTEFDACRRWRIAATDTLRHRRADLVVLSNALWYTRGPRVAPPQGAVAVATWEAGMVKTLGTLHASGIPALVIRDTPVFAANVPFCLARSGWLKQLTNACATDRSRATNADLFAAEQRAAAAVPGTRMIDLTDALCQPTLCVPIVDGIVAYSDREHLTTAMVRQLAPALGAAVP